MLTKLQSIVCLTLVSFVFSANAMAQNTKEVYKAQAGYELAVRMDAVDTSDDSYSEALMTINRGGKKLTRMFTTHSKQMGAERKKEDSLITFDKPADIKGTKYLVWSYRGLDQDDDMWVYLPAESLVRRLSGSSKFASFMRSDLSNEDIQNMDDVEEYDYVLHADEVVDGIDCYVLERIPKEGKDTQYSRQMQWVRKDTLLRLKADYYDKKDRLIKKFFFTRQEEIDGIWTVTEMRVERPLEDSFTVINWSSLRYNVGLSDEYFEHSALQR